MQFEAQHQTVLNPKEAKPRRLSSDADVKDAGEEWQGPSEPWQPG